MTYLFGALAGSAKDNADFILSASKGNITLACTRTGKKKKFDSVYFIGERKFIKFEPIVAHILKDLSKSASIQITEAGVSAINEIARENHTRFPFG